MKSAEPPKPPGRPEQRQRFLAGAVDYVLTTGIGDVSLRPLATHLGTSDRMLLYYFGTRDALIVEILDAVSGRLHTALGSDGPVGRVPPGVLLTRVWKQLTSSELDDALRLYLEVDALAARGLEPFVTVADRVTTIWRQWVSARIQVPPRRRAAAASAMLAIVDGLLLQRLTTDPTAVDAAARWLAVTLRERSR